MYIVSSTVAEMFLSGFISLIIQVLKAILTTFLGNKILFYYIMKIIQQDAQLMLLY